MKPGLYGPDLRDYDRSFLMTLVMPDTRRIFKYWPAPMTPERVAECERWLFNEAKEQGYGLPLLADLHHTIQAARRGYGTRLPGGGGPGPLSVLSTESRERGAEVSARRGPTEDGGRRMKNDASVHTYWIVESLVDGESFYLYDNDGVRMQFDYVPDAMDMARRKCAGEEWYIVQVTEIRERYPEERCPRE